MKNIENTNVQNEETENTEIEAVERKDVAADGISIWDKEICDLLIKTDCCKSIIGFIERESMHLKDQFTIQDIYSAIPCVYKKTYNTIDRETIDNILLEYKNMPIVKNLLEQKPSDGYGGATIIRLLDLIHSMIKFLKLAQF